MQKLLLCCIIVAIFSGIASAKEPAFSFDLPDSLCEDAHAVYLFHHTTYRRSSLSAMSREVHMAVTILSERGEDHAAFILAYDRFSTISKIEGIVYNQTGQVVRKLKKNEIRDFAAYDGFSLFSDNRLKQFRLLNKTYPYTIELKYEIKYKEFLSLSTWYPLPGYNIGVKEKSLTLVTPANLPIFFKQKNCEKLIFSEQQNEKTITRKWTAEALAPKNYERFSPPFDDLAPTVWLAPAEFVFDKHPGKLATWNDMGLWNYNLLETGSELSEKTKEQLKAIKTNAADTADLIGQVYKFMQSRTRYVSIQYGIGGFKPFSPKVVDNVGYGDCKALSYYTQALLGYVGIPSFYTIIGVDDKKIQFDDFPSFNQANHVILCVPVANDTIWLECTSQLSPPNRLSSDALNRKALIVSESGGNLVDMPKRKTNINNNIASLAMNAQGEFVCKTTKNYEGAFFDSNLGLISLSSKELNEHVQRSSTLSDIKIIKTSASLANDRPSVQIFALFQTKSPGSRAGNRLFVELSPFVNFSKMGAQTTERVNPLFIEDNYQYKDEVTFSLPDGYEIESIPKGKKIESSFGLYESEITKEEGTIVFKRRLLIENGTYPKEQYKDFIAFMNQASDADMCKVVLKTN